MQQAGAGHARLVGQQRARKTGERPADDKTHQFVGKDGIAKRLHTGFIFTNALDDPAKTRMRHAIEPRKGERQQCQHHKVENRVIGQIERTERRALRQGQAVITAPSLERNDKVVGHLGKCQGDHDEIDPARSQTDRADQQCEQGGKGRCRRPGEGRRIHPVHREDGNAVGARPEKCRVTEGNHAAKTNHQIEARCSQRENKHATGQTDIEALIDELQPGRQCHQAQQDGNSRQAASC